MKGNQNLIPENENSFIYKLTAQHDCKLKKTSFAELEKIISLNSNVTLQDRQALQLATAPVNLEKLFNYSFDPITQVLVLMFTKLAQLNKLGKFSSAATDFRAYLNPS